MVALATLAHLAAAHDHGSTFGGDDAQARDHLHSTDFHANDLEDAPQGQRILQTRTVTTHPLKIYFDYSLVEDPAVIPWVKALFGDYVGGRMSNLLSVTSDGYMPVISKAGGPSNIGCYTTYPWGQSNPEYLNGSMPYDIIIVVRTYSANTSAIATGQNCHMDPTAKRTILGIMSINMQKWKLVGEDDIEQTANVMTHECMHILGFGKTGVTGFPNTMSSNVNTVLANGTTVPLTYITSPGVVAWARENFNCPTLQGLLWENEGGDGTMNSHWEALTAGNEVITGIVSGKMVVGPLTANYFQDSGAYTVNFAMVEDNAWGRGAGCGFVNADCKVPNSYREFIPTNAYGPNACNYDFTTRVRGSVQGTTGNCSIAWFWSNNTCNRGTTFNRDPNRRGTYGATSRCFIATTGPFSSGDAYRTNAECYKSKCINGGIQFTASDGAVGFCNTTGQNVTINSATKVTCPNIQDFCGNYTVTMTCPNDCSGNGRCLKNGQCSCFFYWSGTDCSTRKACDYGTTVCGLVGIAGGAQVGFQETGSAGLSWFHSFASMIVVMVSIFFTR